MLVGPRPSTAGRAQTRDRYVMRRTIRAICAQVYEHYRRARGVRGDGLSESATNRPHRISLLSGRSAGRGCTGILYVKTVNSSGRELERARGWCYNVYRTTHPSGTISAYLKLTPACNDFACKFRASYESLSFVFAVLSCLTDLSECQLLFHGCSPGIDATGPDPRRTITVPPRRTDHADAAFCG